MKTLLATAFAALTLATPAQAELSPRIKAEARAWSAAFTQAGVRFVNSKSCPPDMAAQYEPCSRTITVWATTSERLIFTVNLLPMKPSMLHSTALAGD